MFEVLSAAAEIEVVCNIDSAYKGWRPNRTKDEPLHAGDIAVRSAMGVWRELRAEHAEFFRPKKPFIEERVVLLSYPDIVKTLEATPDASLFHTCAQLLAKHAADLPASTPMQLPGTLFRMPSGSRIGENNNDFQIALLPDVSESDTTKEARNLQALVSIQSGFLQALRDNKNISTKEEEIKPILPYQRCLILPTMGQRISEGAINTLLNATTSDVNRHFDETHYPFPLVVGRPYVQEQNI